MTAKLTIVKQQELESLLVAKSPRLFCLQGTAIVECCQIDDHKELFAQGHYTKRKTFSNEGARYVHILGTFICYSQLTWTGCKTIPVKGLGDSS